jgi:hypothetical protein
MAAVPGHEGIEGIHFLLPEKAPLKVETRIEKWFLFLGVPVVG